ncbi:CRE-SRE-48 protein [Caenorhabditis remanei]|uniref:CRE-SRE-48 protein n=1 Tax=Caenorhabditis remanei TaxID=31234 RepID=E3MMX1_CAERE|nr:CRE-SRE-48 protein [Caenorhabditis remanei]
MLLSQNYNQKVTRIHEKYAHQSNYSLAARFQAKENIKCFKLIKKVLIAAFCIVVFGFSVAIVLFLNVSPQLDTLWNICILAVMSLPPLDICPAIINSVDSFRNYPFLPIEYFRVKLKIGRREVAIIPRKRSSAKSDDIRKETETYFNQLAASWT